MDIACPQCSTTYSLDPRLIPATGTPVRCSKCGHAFTAHAPGTERPTAPRTETPAMGAVSTDFAEPRSSTQVMGAVSTGFTEPRSSTQVMGAVSADFAEPRSSTQVMGAVSAGFAEPRSSTQVMGAVSAGFAEPRSSTQVMGAVSADFAEPRSSTQVMGAVSTDFAEPRSSTQLDGPLPAARSATPHMGVPGPGPERRATLSFGALGDDFGAAPPRVTSEMGLVLPDEGDGPRRPFAQGPTALPMSAQLGRSSNPAPAKSNRLGWFLGLALVAVVGLIGWRYFGAERGPSEAALSAHDEALRAVRRDDPASLAEASAQLSALLGQHPSFARARADLGLVLALQLDDQKAQADAQHAAQAGLRMQIEALERAKSPGDWQNRVNAIRDALASHDRTLGEILIVESRLKGELAALRGALPDAQSLTDAEDRISITRTHLFAEAVAGSTEAIALLSRFQQEGGPDAWQKVAYATYILNARGAQASGLTDAREGLSAVKTADAVWLRPYVLSARLARAAGDSESVRSNLDAALTLNPKHELAESLRSLLPAE